MRLLLASLGFAAFAILLVVPIGPMTVGGALWFGGMAAGLVMAVAEAVRRGRQPGKRPRERAERPDPFM